MSKQTFVVLTGQSYNVEATSVDEALAIFHVAMGYAGRGEYDEADGYDLSQASLDTVAYIEQSTEAFETI